MPLDLAAAPDQDYDRYKDWIVQDTIVQLQGKLYKVTKVNPKNFQVVDEDGARFNLRRTGSVKRAPRQSDWSGPTAINAFQSDFKLGSTVRLKNASARSKYGNHVYVIIAINSGNTFRLAKLGGTPNNSYLRGFMTTDLELVTGTFTES